MSIITIQIDNHGQPYTVAEMRHRIMSALAKLDARAPVSFSFTARLENYVAAPEKTSGSGGIPKIPDSPETRHATMPAILEAPYRFKTPQPDADAPIAFRGGLFEYAKSAYGPLARPEND